MSPDPQLYIGVMSGTSMDGIDAVLVDFSDQPLLRHHHARSYDEGMRETLLRLSQAAEVSLEELGHSDSRLGEEIATCINTLLSEAGVDPSAVRAIGSHGQTIRHCPEPPYPFTMQIGDPNVIAQRTGIVTVADLRRRDIAVGGQGAPLVPAFHAAVFRSKHERAVLNIGGIANLTLLPTDPASPVRGFDTGPGNVLLDGWVARHLGERMDVDGRWAHQGMVDANLLSRLLTEPYFARNPPKSTGRELFNLTWLDRHLNGDETPADVQATLLTLTALSVANALRDNAPETSELLVCGGGARNPLLMEALAGQLEGVRVCDTDAYGINPQHVEAMAFAWLAYRTLAGETGNLPAVTGAREAVVLGGRYPG